MNSSLPIPGYTILQLEISEVSNFYSDVLTLRNAIDKEPVEANSRADLEGCNSRLQ